MYLYINLLDCKNCSYQRKAKIRFVLKKALVLERFKTHKPFLQLRWHPKILQLTATPRDEEIAQYIKFSTKGSSCWLSLSRGTNSSAEGPKWIFVQCSLFVCTANETNPLFSTESFIAHLAFIKWSLKCPSIQTCMLKSRPSWKRSSTKSSAQSLLFNDVQYS